MTATMQVASYDRYGRPEDIRIAEVPRPTPGAHEVLVRVVAASINSWDWDLVVGSFQGRIGLQGFRRPAVPVLGADISGVVEQVGSNVGGLAPGDEVMADLSPVGWGGFGEYVAVPAAVLALKPPTVDHVAAAAVPQAGVLALQALDKGRVATFSSVVINGAGGGVGTFAVQLAKARGARVTVVDRADKLDRLAALGADRLIDYQTEDFTAGNDCYDCIVDVVAQRAPSAYRRALSEGGRCLVVGGTTQALLQCFLVGVPTSLLGRPWVGPLMHRPNASDTSAVAEQVASGSIQAVVDRTYPLAEVVSALRHYETGDFVGKIVVVVSGG